jgi:hypothetical protein
MNNKLDETIDGDLTPEEWLDQDYFPDPPDDDYSDCVNLVVVYYKDMEQRTRVATMHIESAQKAIEQIQHQLNEKMVQR